MTHQPKAYKKFVATAATATLVATAVAPVAASAASDFVDVNKNYEEAVNYLVEQGITEGMPGNKFGTDLNIKRGDAAVFIARALKLDTENAEDQNFSDLNNRVKGAVNAVVAEGIASGKGLGKFSPDDLITRQEMAKMLSNAYDLTSEKDAPFTDVNKNWMKYVSNLYENGITLGKTEDTFLPNANLTRGEFALFMYRAETLDGKPEEPEVPATDGITSVKAINDTKYEVTFGKAIDEDLAVEIEKSGKRFIAYDGGQTANSKDVIISKTVNFNDERTKAEVIIDTASGEPETDREYTIALMDGDKNEVSSVIYKSEPVILVKGADKPSFEVSSVEDKVILDFKTKMDEKALSLEGDNYVVYENDKKLGDLKDFVQGYEDGWKDSAKEGKWVDSTEKTKVEFKLKTDRELGDKKGLLAGKTYKIKVDEGIKTDDGKTLSETKRTITVKTPSVSDAQPVAKVARVTGQDIVVTFDKDLAEDDYFNPKQITVKKPGGQELTVKKVETQGETSKNLIITVEKDEANGGEELDVDLTYTIDLPANGVANAYFANASNKESKSLKAQAQKDIEVKSVSAKFVQQADARYKADLILTFDQRVQPDELKELVIKEGGDTWEKLANSNLDAEIYSGDTSGKSVIIKDVSSKFELDGKEFKPEKGKTYTIEVPAGQAKTDAGENAKTNQEKLKTTTGGVSISEPTIDKVRMNSSKEIVVEFDEDIDASNLKASDIKVLGHELYANGKFSEVTELSSSQIKYSVSGNKLTIKAADDKVAFATGYTEEGSSEKTVKEAIVTIEADSVKGKDSKVENGKELTVKGMAVKDVVDRATPVIVGAKQTSRNSVELTYSENVNFKGDDNSKQASQFTVDKASKAAYGAEITTTPSDFSKTVKITFNEEDVFKTDVDLSKVEITYAKNTNVLVKDEKGNEAAKQTIKGVIAGDNDTNNNIPKPEKEATKADADASELEALKAYNNAEDTIKGDNDVKAAKEKLNKAKTDQERYDAAEELKNAIKNAEKASAEDDQKAVDAALEKVKASYEAAKETADTADAKIAAVQEAVENDVANAEVTVKITEGEDSKFTVTLTKGDAEATKDITITIAQPEVDADQEAVDAALEKVKASYEAAKETADTANAKIEAVQEAVENDVANAEVTVKITEGEDSKFTVTLTKGDAKATKNIEITIAD